MYKSNIKEYFEKTVIKYSKADILHLLNARLDCAGPLLTVIFNGIDNLGGLCYGYKEYSSTRSTNFMKEKMNIPESLADFLYSAIRCGITHQGAPKIGLRFFVFIRSNLG